MYRRSEKYATNKVLQMYCHVVVFSCLLASIETTSVSAYFKLGRFFIYKSYIWWLFLRDRYYCTNNWK